MDLSGNALHALPNFSDLFARCSSLVWLSLGDCGLDGKADLDAVAEFIDSNPPLEYLDLSDNNFGAALATKLAPALARNYRLRSLSLFGCAVSVAQAEDFRIAAGCCAGLALFGLPGGNSRGVGGTGQAEAGTLVASVLSSVAETALERYSRIVLVDSGAVLADPLLLRVPFLESLELQRSRGLGKNPSGPAFPLRNLTNLVKKEL